MIKKLNVKNFGGISNKELSFGKNFNIIFGENETGKSTIHDALRSLLFGFSPAKLENHSYKPWDESKIFLEGEIETDKSISVARKLSDKAEANTIVNGEIRSIANKALEDVNQVSRDVFKQVYAVTLDDMNSLSNRSMELVFDGLVENYGLDFLNSPSEVIKEIQLKENEIYRENRRGKYRLKEIDDEMKLINSEIRSSEKSIDDYFKSKIEIEEVEKLKKEMKINLNEINRENNKIIELMEIVKQRNFLKDLKEDLKLKKHNFALLLEHIKSIKEIKLEIAQKEDNLKLLNSDIEGEALKSDILSDEEKNVLIKRPNYIIAKNYINRLAQIISDKDYKNNIKSENTVSRKLIERELFSRELTKSEIEALESLDTVSLKRYIEDEYKDLGKNQKTNIVKELFLPIMLAFSIILSMYFAYNLIAYISSIILSAIIMKIYKDYKNDRREINIYDAKIGLLLGELPVPRIFVESVDLNYFDKLFRLRDIQLQNSKVDDEIDLIEISIKELFYKIVTKLEDERLVDEDINLLTLNSILEEFNRSVDNIKLKELSKKSSEDRVKELRDRYNTLLDEKNMKKELLESKLDDIHDTFSIAYELIETLLIDDFKISKACEVQNALNNMIDISSKYEQIELLESNGAKFTAKYLSDLKIKSTEISEELSVLENKIGKLNEKIKYLYSTDKRDDLYASLKSLKTEREEIMIKRAILTSTRESIARYDKEFRDENQPDILKNTSEYFALVTDNKYQKVYMQSETNELILRSEFGERNIDDGFSRGTKEQLYFCFRLAIIKHLSDEKKHNLPIILDDIFVNWDISRIKNLKKLILKISEDRQIIMFTCHKSQLEVFGDEQLINRVIL